MYGPRSTSDTLTHAFTGPSSHYSAQLSLETLYKQRRKEPARSATAASLTTPVVLPLVHSFGASVRAGQGELVLSAGGAHHLRGMYRSTISFSSLIILPRLLELLPADTL